MKDKITVPLTLLHIFDPATVSYRGFAERTLAEIEEEARGAARQFIDEQQQKFTAAGMEAKTVVAEGHIRETICELADSGEYDLLVIGKQADGDLRNLLFDQIANYVVHHVKCPVLIV